MPRVKAPVGRTCPSCKSPADFLGADPEPGDVTVCIYCVAESVIDEHLELRRLTEVEHAIVRRSDVYQQIQAAKDKVRQHHREQGTRS